MGLFDGILIYSDVDNTLVHHSVLSAETEKAVRYFQQNGGLFSVATGRTPEHIQQFMPRFIPNTYLISCNGTLIYDCNKKQKIWEKPFDENWMDYVESVLEKFPKHKEIAIMTGDGLVVAMSEWNRAEAEKLPRPIYKAVFRQEPTQTPAMVKEFATGYPFEGTQSCPVLFEISALETGKAVCIRKMRELLGDKIKTVICAGDYHNDIAMLQEADIGVAVQGGHPETLRVADWIAPPIEEHPIAWLIYEIERKLISENSL